MIRYIYLAGCLLLNITLKAQAPVAAFTASVTSGCAPLNVTFTDQSTGSPLFWDWEVSNGADVKLATSKNPSFSLGTPGSYTVKLVVRSSNGTNGITKTAYINVLSSPLANFTANITTACQPATINFQDLSTTVVGTLNAWSWSFGDGGTSTQRNPSHTFKDNGFYTVTLTATSTSGCSGSASFGRYIRVVSGVKADFEPKPADTCIAPFNVNFNNLTSAPGNVSYLWRYHDGTTATGTNPPKLYPASGSFNVKLIATSDLGCQDSIQKQISVSGSNVQFTPPAGPCVNTPLTFTNTSATGALSTAWDFGDGTQSTQVNPAKTYTLPGTYTVSLSSIYSNCKGTTTKTITVTPPPAVDFSASNIVACKAPLTTTFTANAPSATKWSWDFGDNTPLSTAQNPTHTYATTGSFNVTLTITNANGCTNTLTKNSFINIAPPEIKLVTPGEGCINTAYHPLASGSISVSSPEAIASYTWNWGDGSPASTGQSASHVYTTEGIYTVTLTVVTLGGCSVTATLPGAALFGNPVTADFTVDKQKLCDRDPAQFTNTSSPAGDAWLWNFGDGNLSTTENPSHSFGQRRLYTISLTTRNKGCYDTKTKPAFIEALKPLADFRFNVVDCNDPRQFTFISTSDTSAPPVTSTYLWDFGGGITATGSNTNFTFLAFGTYNVTLTVTDNDNFCSSPITKSIAVFKENATLSSDKAVYCKNENVRLTATVGQPQYITQYQWQINGGAPFIKKNATFDTTFTATGTYILTSTLTDINGCTIVQSSPLSVAVIGPTAQFDIPDNKGCKDEVISFTDQSIASAGLKSWVWTWGDAKDTTYTSPAAAVTHRYKDSGSYTVRLTVTDNNGCPDTREYKDTIKIRQPNIGFKAAYTLFCRGGELQFTDTSKGYGLTYEWDFGDGKTSTDQNPKQIYDGPDNKYTVALKITDDAGCSATLPKPQYIEIRSPKPAFTVSDSISLCRVFETRFTFAGKDYESFSWDFGDFATTTAKDPTHFYNEYGNYTAKLYLTGYGGCVDSAMHSVKVIPADASMISYAVPPPFKCQELLVDFTLIPPPSVSFYFNFGDPSSIDTSKSLTLSHLYKQLGSWGPSLVMTDKQGCQSTANGHSSINIIGSFPFFGQDRKEFCDGGQVAFRQFIVTNDPPITSYVWNFGDGSPAVTNTDAIHTYASPGTYITSLTAYTASCLPTTLTDTVRVYRTPTAVINSDNNVCVNSQITFKAGTVIADTAITWKWTVPGAASTDSVIALKPTTAGQMNITLQATNKIGCSSPVETKAITVNPLPVISMPPSITTPVGVSLPIPVTYNDPALTYLWTPATYLDCTDCPVPTVVTPKFATTYRVKVTDNNSCVSNGTIKLNTICNNINYFVPNTFSPNGDGNNDWFYPRGTFINNVQSLRIFNRWGELVFEKRNLVPNNMADGWNGMYKGKPAMADVYVYIMELICENAQIVPVKGDVTLIR